MENQDNPGQVAPVGVVYGSPPESCMDQEQSWQMVVQVENKYVEN